MKNELSKHTLNLYSGDYAHLRDLYPELGAGPVIRRLIRVYIEQTETKSESPTTQIII